MAITVEERAFLNKDKDSIDAYSYNINIGNGYPDAYFQISINGESLYMETIFHSRKDLNESLHKFIVLRDALDDFISLVKENQTEGLKAAITPERSSPYI